ncbi:MAG: hypothetical protein ACLFUH_01180 [Bacteroidales bacterium]
MLPPAVGSFSEDYTETQTQSLDEQYAVNTLNSTVTEIDSSEETATIEINDTETDGDPITETIDEDANATYAFDNGDVTVTLTEIEDDDTVMLKYQMDNTFGWGDGAAQLFGFIPLFLILAALLFVVSYVRD